MQPTAIVLCGGRSSRFGSDKTRAPLDGRPLLDHLLDALPGIWPIVAVGPRRTTTRDITWVREEPAFAGPLAALAAGLADVATPTFVLLGGDMPYAARAAVALSDHLSHAPHDVDAVLARTPDGRPQPLLLAGRTEPARDALPPDPVGASLMSWARRLRCSAYDVDDTAAHDVDTPQDLAGPPHAPTTVEG
ncbi:NTP transferase domain-containing protein [Allobranchiibius sp. GilTou38]|uniref:molybdenum cofactor guanylyltransferase n=1 Tax=Allobranchiibius sp. GilTou38 TaxID=2815210 RepID=UPI001AA0C09A|nr:NTP transferase domain-containing protein [Allobranchiibius sp. GilTou38]MBO1767221.1 NTP transferase domain-containing protein [Allobranchiibius sp. GilTou38]